MEIEEYKTGWKTIRIPCCPECGKTLGKSVWGWLPIVHEKDCKLDNGKWE